MTQGSTDWRPLAAVLIAITATMTSGWIYGRGVFFLVLAGFVLLGVIWIFWRSLQSLTGDAPLSLEEALGLSAPSAEEERKVAVLRALKDLEYERSVGKISEQDYRELSHKYRTEAKRLLQMVDEQLEPARQRAEERLQEHLKSLAIAPPEPSPRAGSTASSSPAAADDQRTPTREASPAALTEGERPTPSPASTREASSGREHVTETHAPDPEHPTPQPAAVQASARGSQSDPAAASEEPSAGTPESSRAVTAGVSTPGENH